MDAVMGIRHAVMDEMVNRLIRERVAFGEARTCGGNRIDVAD